MVAVRAPWHHDWDDLGRLLLTEAWAYHAQHAARAALYRPAIAEFLEAAENFTDAAAYLAAQERRAAGTAVWERWFAEGGSTSCWSRRCRSSPTAAGRAMTEGTPEAPATR